MPVQRSMARLRLLPNEGGARASINDEKRKRREAIIKGLEEADRIEKELDNKYVAEDNRRGAELAERFSPDHRPLGS